MDPVGSYESFFHQLVPFAEGDQQLLLSLYQQQQQGGAQTQNNNNGTNNTNNNNNNTTVGSTQPSLPTSGLPAQPASSLFNTQGPQQYHQQMYYQIQGQQPQQQQAQQQAQQQQQGKKSKKQQQLLQQQQNEIKKEPPSPDSDSDSDREREKKNRSRANQNLASRNYRQRKKEYIRDIEEKLAVLALENDQLKKENLNLKKGGGLEIMKPDPAFITMMMEAKQIIIQLDVAIKKNDDRSLIYLLQLFHLSIEKRHSIIEREVEKMVHPYTQAKLAAMGYVPSLENPMISSISGPSSDGWWIKYMSEAQITEDQSKAIKQLRANHWKADIELRNERERLDRSIKEFYLSKVMVFPTNERLNKSFAANLSITDAPIPQPINNTITDANSVDISEILEFTRKLEHLKKNFVKQRTLMEDTHAALSAILTPRQEAMLLVRVHYSTRYDFANMEMLKNVWGSVVSKDSNFPPPPPQFPPSLMNSNPSQINNNLLNIQNMYSPYSVTSANNNNNNQISTQQQQQQQQQPQINNTNQNHSSPLLMNNNTTQNNNTPSPVNIQIIPNPPGYF